ncbi:hypothetical protein V8B97DRAFT_1918589 [Scleroderma yunnanense]
MPSLLGPPSMLSQIDVDPCTTAAVFTLVLYDYILTVSREIELFWRRPKRSWAFVFFVANRYITILGQIIQVIYTFLSPTIRSYYTWCDSLLLMIQVVVFVVQLIGGAQAIMTMRVYALYHNSRPVLIFLLALMFVASIIGCWAIFSNGFTPSGLTVLSVPQLQSTGGVGCSSGAYLSSEQAVYMAAAWSGQLAFDVVVFLLTLVRSLRIRKEGSRSIVDILLRDGSLYFAVMCGANVVNIIVLLNLINTGFKAYVEPSGSGGNRSDEFGTVFTVTCKHGIYHATYWFCDWCQRRSNSMTDADINELGELYWNYMASKLDQSSQIKVKQHQVNISAVVLDISWTIRL